MSRVKTGPVTWRDEGPQSPYSPTVRLGGALVTAQPTMPSPVLPAQRTTDAAARQRDWNGGKERAA